MDDWGTQTSWFSLSTAFARIYLDIKRTMYINICICRRCVYPRRVHLDVNNTERKEEEEEEEEQGGIGRGQDCRRNKRDIICRAAAFLLTDARPQVLRLFASFFFFFFVVVFLPFLISIVFALGAQCVCDRCECVVGAQPNTRMNQREPMATIPIHQPADCGVTKPLRRGAPCCVPPNSR